MARAEEREERRREPLRKELERYFEGLPPLPPPLPKASEWWRINLPCNYINTEVRPFFVACEEGSLDEVKRWVLEKREVLRQIGLQDGLACAAKESRVDVVRYLLEEGGASLDCSVVEAACSARSLPLFELCIQHGYDPNQLIPSHDGVFGVAVNHCLDDEDITRFLLDHGADPDLAPFLDSRRLGWGARSTPPMDQKCGLALDKAVENSSIAVIQMLLEHGANPNYARRLHKVVLRCYRNTAARPGVEHDWRLLMEMMLRYGADVNAMTYHHGGYLLYALFHLGCGTSSSFYYNTTLIPLAKMPTRVATRSS